MIQASTKPPGGGKQRFPTFAAFGRWVGKVMCPSKFFWRRVESTAIHRLEFQKGGERFLVVGGYICLAFTWCFLWVCSKELRRTFPLIQYALSQKNYGSALNIYALIVTPSLLALETFCFGIWFIFGRTRITLDTAKGRFLKEYRLLEFCLLRRFGDIQDVISVSVHRNSGFWWLISRRALYLDRKRSKPIKLTTVDRPCESQGQQMAREIAQFLGLPGPAESDFANSQKPD